MPIHYDHSPKAIAKRLAKPPTQSYLRDWIYGGIDGAVTTFAVVSGVIGGKLASLVIIILGMANLIADGFSMAASNYLGTKSEQEEFQRYRQIEEEEIERFPEGEKEEIRQIYANKGLSGEALTQLVDFIISKKELWVETMLYEEYGLPKNIRSPTKAATSTFSAFIICGFVPLIPYVFSFHQSISWSVVLTGIVFFIIGSVKSQWTLRSWWASGLITLLIGAAAAVLAYGVGFLLQRYVH